MAAKTKRGSIPSIKINKQFLRDLGDILEAEVKERNERAEQKNKEEIISKNQEIDARTYYKNDAEKEQAKVEAAEWVRRSTRPRIGLTYTIDARNEDLTFTSIQEVIDTKFFPENIKSIACSISHYGEEEYVDVNINISKRWFGIGGDYKLSSSSEQRLLKIENDLKSLFRQNPTEYKTLLYPTEKSPYLIPRVLTALVATTVAYLSFQNFGEEIKSDGGAVGTLVFWIILAVYWFCMEVIKWAFPYFKFEIINENQLSKYTRILIGIAITAVIGGAFF